MVSDALAAAEEDIILAFPRPAPSHFGHLFSRQALWSRPVNLHLPRPLRLLRPLLSTLTSPTYAPQLFQYGVFNHLLAGAESDRPATCTKFAAWLGSVSLFFYWLIEGQSSAMSRQIPRRVGCDLHVPRMLIPDSFGG